MFNCSEGDALKTEVEILLNDEPVVLSVFCLATLFATAHRNGITADEALTHMVRMATDPTQTGSLCVSSESALLVNGEGVEFDHWAVMSMRAEAYLGGQTLDSVLERKITEFLDNPALLIGVMESATA